jgi:tRNA threonylcarbamoyladenosine biosynthesis protein TsaE
MGAGKTTLIQFILRAMGIEETDGSPTYSLVNVYNSPYFGTVNHFDLYRLNSLEEVFDIGFEEMLYANQICLIEWADLVLDELPENTIHVKITSNEDGTRQISW